jgi:hypothetical protein
MEYAMAGIIRLFMSIPPFQGKVPVPPIIAHVNNAKAGLINEA